MKNTPLLLLSIFIATLVSAQSPQPPPARQPLPPPVEEPPTSRPPTGTPPVEPPPVRTPPLQTPPPGTPPPMSSEAASVPAVGSFESVDANHDGFLSLEEFNTSRLDVQTHDGPVDFTSLDKNGDGRISPEEWTKRAPSGEH